MKKILEIIRRPVYSLLLLLLITLPPAFLSDWGTGKAFVSSINDSPVTFLIAAAITALLRKFLFGRSAKFFVTLGIYYFLLGLGLVPLTRMLGGGLTFLSSCIYIFAASAVAIVVWDPVEERFKAFLSKTGFGRFLKNPFTALFVFFIIFGALASWTGTSPLPSGETAGGLNFIFILLAIATLLLRRKHGKTGRLLAGIGIFYFAIFAHIIISGMTQDTGYHEYNRNENWFKNFGLYCMLILAAWAHYNAELFINNYAKIATAVLVRYKNLRAGISAAGFKKSLKSALGKAAKFIKAGYRKVTKINKTTAKKVKTIAGYAFLLILLIVLGNILYNATVLRVIGFTPKGVVGDKTVVTITFNGPVKVKNGDINTAEAFTITPSLPGQYKFQDEKTIVFTPSEQLKPSTFYKVKLNRKKLDGGKKSVQWFASTKFNTSVFAVKSMRLFYSYDLIKNIEKQVMGEINFNYPVELSELQKCLKAAREGEPLAIELEKSGLPSRFYIKTGEVKREDRDQKIKFQVSRALRCVGGTSPMGENYVKELDLAAKMKFEMTEITPWHQAGSTYISAAFNMPVSADQVRAHISIKPAIPFTVETEYCYALLKADFPPNKDYEVEITPGLISKTGEVLGKDYTRKTNVRISDLPPAVTFVSKGNILPVSGAMNIELKTVNLDKVRITVDKVFKSDVFEFTNRSYGYSPVNVFSQIYDVTGGRINDSVTSYINLRKLYNLPYKGLFQVSVEDLRYRASDKTWILCTDLGIMAKHSGNDLIVYVLSILDTEPAAGTLVKLYSSSNQLMQEGYTAKDGSIVFKDWKEKWISGLNGAGFHLIGSFLTAEKADDFSFMKIDQRAINQNSFQVAGEYTGRSSYDAFLTTERGVYRPGEKVYVTALLRAKDLSTPKWAAGELETRGPNNADLGGLKQTFDDNGLASFVVEIPAGALTGEYRSFLRIPAFSNSGVYGEVAFKVEEFIPDKIKVDIKCAETIHSGEKLEFSVNALQLFGAPASGLKVAAVVKFMERDFRSAKYKDYSFKDTGRNFSEDTQDLGEDKLDNAGVKKYVLEIPGLKPPSALKAQIYTEVYDSGGRPVSSMKYADVYNYPYYIGLKMEKKPVYLIKDRVNVAYVAVDSKDELQKVKNVQVVIKRKVWYSMFKDSGWSSGRYNSMTYDEVLRQESVDIDGTGNLSFTPDLPGDYTVSMGSDNEFMTVSTIHVAGPGYESFSVESPERLELALDKDLYTAGEDANITVAAPFDGKLFLTIEREKVFETKIVEVVNRKAAVSFRMAGEYVPNVYAVGMLIRKPAESLKTMPMVSFGIVPVYLDKRSSGVALTLSAPVKTDASKGIDVTVKVDSDPENTGVVLSAVNEGILQITNYKTPNPLDFFFKKKALSTATFSIFELILPEIRALKEAIGGGEGMESKRRHLNPVEVAKPKSLAIYSGILKPDAEGLIKYHFDTQGFNGEVRVMALAASGKKFASAQKSVSVADPIVIIPSFPSAACPDDRFALPVLIYNKTGLEGPFTVELSLKGPIKAVNGLKKNIYLKIESEEKLIFDLASLGDAGPAKITVTAEGCGKKISVSQALSIRPAAHLVTVREGGEIAPGGTAKINLPQGYINYGRTSRFNVSGYRLVRYLGSLDYLISYPYGCGEQVTSRVFPLIYMKELGFATGRFSDKANSVDLYVQEGIKKLEILQKADGGFTMWDGGETESDWLSNYISHFLIEADKAGYDVNANVLARVKERIERASPKKAQGRLDRSENSEAPRVNVYILYLKALMGAPDKETMAYAKEKKLKELDEVDRCLLSLCYSSIGDRKTALEVLKPDWKSAFIYREQYGSMNSPVRNTAIYLMALANANPGDKRIDKIIDYLGTQIKNGHFGSTQENAWVFIGLSNAIKSDKRLTTAEVSLDGGPVKVYEGETTGGLLSNGEGKVLTIKNTSPKTAYYDFMAEGTPLNKGKGGSAGGLSIKKQYFDENGKTMNLKSVMQGQLVVVTIKVKAKKPVNNLIIVDILPGGFEIENPRLSSRGELAFSPDCNMSYGYRDIRSDRMLIFKDALSGEESYSYTVRAVTPGTFVIPNAFTEAMYDPEINAEANEESELIVAPNN